ncbi:TonB-dependent receptor [Daejeonella sp. H1SJ63]|uniref:TonB-dependent receptor n=1 Tax=Daejeonella sp. H1SJ63 TaxID=3034145 RepID=UPI0023EB0CD5|nr:TonB-dependent receptor [Daejeonella sp. H1SJ63]
MNLKRSLILFCLIFFVFISNAQNKQVLISAEYKNATIREFVSDLEQKTDYRFYYDALQFDSLRVTLSAKDDSVSSIIKKAFLNTKFRFAIDLKHNVFLTKDLEIFASLPYGIFDSERDSLKWKGQQEILALADLSAAEVQSVQSSALSNKIVQIGNKNAPQKSGNISLAGYVRDAKTGTPVTGAAVFIEQPRIGTYTDQFGYYSLALPRGPHVLNIKALGIIDLKRPIILYSEGKLDIDIQSQVLSLKEVIISAESSANVRNVQMGVQKLSISSIKQVPVAFGEADIMKVMLTLPGVKSVGEAGNGFNVRGGAVDQNLIQFDDLTIYNPSHFFGFFSAFNPDVVKDVELYKSSIPSRFGGRLASVLDVNSRDGNNKKLSGKAGIGLLTGRINLEGPIIKDRTSFIMGARTTYSNWILKLLPDDSGYKNSKAAFYDMNLRISHKINDKNSLYISGYLSDDNSNLGGDTTFTYSNKNLSLKWKHIFSNKLTGLVVGGFSRYQYDNQSDQNPVNAYKMAFDINQANFKTDFNYYLSPKHTIDFGLSSIRYQLHPGTYLPLGSRSLVVSNVLQTEQAIESAAYLGDRFDLTDKLSLDLGVRYSMFNYLGPKSVNQYLPGLPVEPGNSTGSTNYQKGELVKTYHGPEMRFSGRYQFTDALSVKAAYNTLRQYIHLLTNSTAISPTDIWKLSDPNIKPQYGDQFSLGLYRNFKNNTVELSVEGYYKRLKDYLDYKSGASLIMNHHIETDVLNTKGKAYGVEFLIKKPVGKLNGWIGYTYSRTLLKTDDPTVGQLINRGNYYPANFDKPNDLTLVGNYRFSHRFSASFNATYSTGRPITVPVGKYYYAGSLRASYSDRNALRAPDYFRTDFSVNIEGNHKIHQLTHSSWTIGVYNLTGRDNAYSTYFISQKGVIRGYQLSIFGNAIPFVNYNIRF